MFHQCFPSVALMSASRPTCGQRSSHEVGDSERGAKPSGTGVAGLLNCTGAASNGLILVEMKTVWWPGAQIFAGPGGGRA